MRIISAVQKISRFLYKVVGGNTFKLAVVFFTSFLISASLSAPHSSKANNSITRVNITPVIAINTPSSLTLNATPTPSGVFVKEKLDLSITTNNQTGYTLVMNNNDSDTKLHHTASPSSTISSITNPNLTAATFAMNSWGYGTDGINFNPIPIVSAPVTLKTASSAINNDVTSVHFGAKVNNSLVSGTYQDNIIFSVTTSHVPSRTFSNITTMQEMTSTICAAETTPLTTAAASTYEHTLDNNFVPEAKLTDIRDNKTYIVRKLADGNCWMSQNLSYNLVAGQELNSMDTDLNTISSWMPDDADVSYINPPGANEDQYLVGGTTLSPTGLDTEKRGTTYSWSIATVRTHAPIAPEVNSSDSICPKGWTLPRHTGDKSFINLFNDTYGFNISVGTGGYGPEGSARSFPFNLIRESIGIPGYQYFGEVGEYHTSAFHHVWNSPYTLHISFKGSFHTHAHTDTNGLYSIRCIAR